MDYGSLQIEHVLVTGGAGFIGSHTAAALIDQGFRVTVADNLSNGFERNIPNRAEFIEMDLSREEDYVKLKDLSCDAVYHFAAQSSGSLSFQTPVVDLKSHVFSTFYLLEWCRRQAVNRFLYASSTTTYGDPLYLPVDEKHPQRPKTYYAAGKMAAEAYINFFGSQGIDTTIFRLPNVYGPGQNFENKDQGMISIYHSYILENQPILVKGSVDRFRDFLYIDDAVEAFLKALAHPRACGCTYNVASGKKTRVQEIIDGLINAVGFDDYPVLVKDGTPGDQLGMVCDASRIQNDLGWRAKTPIQAGLIKTVKIERNITHRE